MAGIMSLCTGFILALQSASELRKFGALEFVVDLVTVAPKNGAIMAGKKGPAMWLRYGLLPAQRRQM